MKRVAFLCLAATLLSAQAAAPEVEITNEPHHHLTFENKSVRVFNVQVDPNTETQTHWHRHDYIAITLGPAEISNHIKDKPPATVKFQDGDTRFTSATFAHFVRTLGPEPFRNVTIEILEDESLRNSSAKWDEQDKKERGLEVLTGGTKQILFVKDGVRATEFELQPGAVVPMHHHTGPYLLVAVSDLDLRSDVQNPDKGGSLSLMPGHFKSGDSKWLPGNYSHTITNTGTKPAKFVTLEFP
jgi:quercetin dioxygenase-like cupin family protein